MSVPWRIMANTTGAPEGLGGARTVEDRGPSDRHLNGNIHPALEDLSSTMRRRPISSSSSNTINIRTDMTTATTTTEMAMIQAMVDNTIWATEEERLRIKTIHRKTTMILVRMDPGGEDGQCPGEGEVQ